LGNREIEFVREKIIVGNYGIDFILYLITISEMEGTPIKCKIVLLGDQSVGKTSIINRFIFDNFTGN
jgi:GTPase SAR1 family protein